MPEKKDYFDSLSLTIALTFVISALLKWDETYFIIKPISFILVGLISLKASSIVLVISSSEASFGRYP